MWIDRETLTELIEAISKVEEVGTVANDDCMGEEVIKLRVSIVIIKPLMMILELSMLSSSYFSSNPHLSICFTFGEVRGIIIVRAGRKSQPVVFVSY